VFNDAVIIILYQTVIAAANAKDITPFQNALYSVAGFVYLFFVSLILGALFGLFTAYLLKLTREKAMEEKIHGEQLLHVLIMLTSPIVSYLIAQVIILSKT
jgi:NhaP-type Na+/H+ or K+/H+ antiporter